MPRGRGRGSRGGGTAGAGRGRGRGRGKAAGMATDAVLIVTKEKLLTEQYVICSVFMPLLETETQPHV